MSLLGAAGAACVGAGLELGSLSVVVWMLAALTLAPALHWAAYGVRGAREPR